MLRAVGRALLRRREEIIRLASDETGLTPEELDPEFSRARRTLDLFAQTIESPAWQRAWHRPPEAEPAAAIGPNHDLRVMLAPLRGVVIVFGASNFPLAYGVCGGDTASALAAGCPVVVKEHPAHRATGRLLALIAREAIEGSGICPDALVLAEDDESDTPGVARRLIEHPAAAAVGFTGSGAVGASLCAVASRRGRPIPVFAEMGSVNPTLIFPGALAARREAILDAIAASMAQRYGQQCTCPGLILLPGVREGRDIARKLSERLSRVPIRRMLSRSVAVNYDRAVARVRGAAGVTVVEPWRGLGAPVVLHASAPDAAAQRDVVLETEMFGPGAVVIDDPLATLLDLPLPGSLTLSLWCEPEEVPSVRAWLERETCEAGRVVFNGVPTGVRVDEAMVHSGGWPASSRPDTTAVGPRAIERWCRPLCVQNAPSV